MATFGNTKPIDRFTRTITVPANLPAGYPRGLGISCGNNPDPGVVVGTNGFMGVLSADVPGNPGAAPILVEAVVDYGGQSEVLASGTFFTGDRLTLDTTIGQINRWRVAGAGERVYGFALSNGVAGQYAKAMISTALWATVV